MQNRERISITRAGVYCTYITCQKGPLDRNITSDRDLVTCAAVLRESCSLLKSCMTTLLVSRICLVWLVVNVSSWHGMCYRLRRDEELGRSPFIIFSWQQLSCDLQTVYIGGLQIDFSLAYNKQHFGTIRCSTQPASPVAHLVERIIRLRMME